MMAAAVCLGEDISPKRLLSLGSLLFLSCLSQGRWRLGNPGSKYIQFLPSHNSRGHSSTLQNLRWAVLQKAPQCTSKSSSTSCTAVTSPCSPLSSDRICHQSKGHPGLADQWILPTDSQCLWDCPQFPQGWWFTSAPQWHLRVSSHLARTTTALNFLPAISVRQKTLPKSRILFLCSWFNSINVKISSSLLCSL